MKIEQWPEIGPVQEPTRIVEICIMVFFVDKNHFHGWLWHWLQLIRDKFGPCSHLRPAVPPCASRAIFYHECYKEHEKMVFFISLWAAAERRRRDSTVELERDEETHAFCIGCKKLSDPRVCAQCVKTCHVKKCTLQLIAAQWNVFPEVLFRCEKVRPTTWFRKFLTFWHMNWVFFSI